MSQTYNIAIVGATGAVGETLLEILTEREFPVGEVALLASERSAGKTIRFAGKSITVQDVATFDFSNTQIAFFSAGGEVSKQYAPLAADCGCVVIDNTSYFRYDPDIPLVVPEVNPEDIANYRERFIIANPNCSTIQMLVALKPIYDEVGIVRINVATYQSVSGAGRSAINELASQTSQLMNGHEAEAKVMPVQIAFNAVPQIDVMQDNGYTKEEMKMVWETQKMFHDPDILVNPTAVRVPVFYGHSEAVHIETQQPIAVEQAAELLRQAQGIEYIDNEEGFPTAITHGANNDKVFVGRLRQDISHPNGLNLWVVSDNIRKGAALNAVQIAEYLIENEL